MTSLLKILIIMFFDVLYFINTHRYRINICLKQTQEDDL